jgi:hypothetical protein
LSENGSASTLSQAFSGDANFVAEFPPPNVLGGPPEVGSLLVQLGKSQPLSSRIDAALKLRALLEEYRLSQPLTVWSVGEDLLDHDASDAFRAGLVLLLACASCHDLGANERHVLFDSLEMTSSSTSHLDLRVQILRSLTRDGKNIESIERTVLSLSTETLASCYQVSSAERRERRSNGSSKESTLTDIFKLVMSIIKFNAQSLVDEDLDAVVAVIDSICQSTTATHDVENCTEVVVALLTFTQLPAASFRRCLELIADIYRQVVNLRSRAWTVAANVFTSHLGPGAITAYLGLVRGEGRGVKRMVRRGAFRLLAHLFELNGSQGLPVTSLAALLPAASRGLDARDAYLAHDVLELIKKIWLHGDLQLRLKEEFDWTAFTECLKKSSDTLGLNTFTGKGFTQADVESRSESTLRGVQSEASTMRKSRSTTDAIDPSTSCRVLNDIILKLAAALPNLEITHKDAIITLFLGLGHRLNNVAAETLLTCCAQERLISPTTCGWLENCKTVVVSFIHDSDRPTHLRELGICVFKQAWDTIELVSSDAASDLVLLLLQTMDSEADGIVLDALASFAAMAAERADEALFEVIMTIFRVTIFQRRHSQRPTASLSPLGGFPVGLPTQTEPSLCRTAAKHVIRMFISNLNKSARKTEALFTFILKVAASSECAVDARICAIKLLSRLRATSNYALYIRPLPESERIAAILCRTVDTAKWSSSAQFGDDEGRDSNGSQSPQGSNKSRAFDIRKPVPPLWFYPGPKGLPEEPPDSCSSFVYSHQGPDAENMTDAITVLQLALWLETVITLLQQPDTDWEIYSYLVVHTGAQLANQNLFRGCIRQIRFLRSVLCDQIRAGSFHEPPSYTSLKKADVAVCLFQVLTMLIGYHPHFARSEEDELVRTFISGIGSWDRTSKWCIHALSVCCHELPLSVSKMLDSIIQKMSQIITQSQVAVHILEFLVMLARLPELYKNFREDEFKMVFGVSFRYLQYVRDKQEHELSKDMMSTPARNSKTAIRNSDSFRELRTLNDSDHRAKHRTSKNEDLPQYVYALAFHVITFWFMNLRLDDRPMYMPWISKNLTYQTSAGRNVVEDQGLVTMDMMAKVAYTDRDETIYDAKFAKEVDGEVTRRTWIVGLSLVTVETAGRTGLSQLIRRRPSGTKYSIFRPALTSPPRHQVPLTSGLAADAFYTSTYTGVLPEDIIQEFYSSFNLPDITAHRPVILPDDEGVARAISSFDRNSTVDGHKVGVIYVADGQQTEANILQNTHGSAEYTAFIRRLGSLTRLKGAQFNTQGLDRADDSDGQYTYCWRDRATELVFHITTMMPTNLEHDPQGVKKKSHIGNDYVNIVWNDSGMNFEFDTFPSAFNYVYIIITPESAHSLTTRERKEPGADQTFKVQVMSAPGIPEISPAAETKLLSAKALPEFIRLLALNASVFSLVWQNREGGEHFSPWRNRLREIKRLRDKYIGADGRPLHTASPANAAKIVPPSTIEKAQNESLPGGPLMFPPTGRERGGSALSHRHSYATFSGSDDLSRSSLTTSSVGDRGGHDSDH